MAVITRRVTIPPKRTSVIFDVPTPSGDVTVSGNPEAVQKALPSIRRGHGGGGGVTVTPQDTTASTAQAEAARQAQAQQQADAQRIQQQVAQRQLVQQYAGARGTAINYRVVPTTSTQPGVVRRAITEFAVGETGKQYVGVGWRPFGITRATPLITAQKAKEVLREKGKLPGKVAAEFIPETPLEVGIIGGTAAIFPYVPPVARIPIGTGISVMELKQVINPKLPTEQRIASGIIGGLVGTGTFFEALPFIKGGTARLSPKYKPTKVQPEGFKAVVEIKGAERIGLIPKGAPLKTGETKGINLLIISPLRRGGFGVTPSQKPLYLGEQTVATSQRGLFKEGKTISLEKDFFVTPAEPFIKIPETRISRLGLIDLTKVPKDVEIGFGFPLMPQIGLTKTSVGFRETPSQFAIGKGTELEAIKTFGDITDISKLGTTTIKGQAVDIYGFKIGGKGTGTLQEFPVTTQGTSRTSGEVLTGITAKIKSFFPTRKTGSTPISATTTSTSFIDYYPTLPSAPARPTSPTISIRSGGSPPVTSPPSISIPPTTFIPPTSKLPIYKTPTGRTPTISPPLTTKLTLPKHPTTKNNFFKSLKLPKQSFGKFSVFGRRFGKFKLVGISGTEKGAFSLGKKFAIGSLGRSFYVRGGAKQPLKIPGFRTKKEKVGQIYIQNTGKGLFSTLGSKGEKAEIQFYKKLKGGNK